jgi:phage-related minor tail protein
MMEKLLERGDELAEKAQSARVQRVAQRLRALVGSGAVTVEETQVLVSGRGIVKRWLIDPSLRFLSGEHE